MMKGAEDKRPWSAAEILSDVQCEPTLRETARLHQGQMSSCMRIQKTSVPVVVRCRFMVDHTHAPIGTNRVIVVTACSFLSPTCIWRFVPEDYMRLPLDFTHDIFLSTFNLIFRTNSKQHVA